MGSRVSAGVVAGGDIDLPGSRLPLSISVVKKSTIVYVFD
jgi:hypothetical protein